MRATSIVTAAERSRAEATGATRPVPHGQCVMEHRPPGAPSNVANEHAPTRRICALEQSSGRVRSGAVQDAPARARQARRVDWLLYLTAAVTYVAAGVYEKFFLNWVIGPLWLIGWCRSSRRSAAPSAAVPRGGRSPVSGPAQTPAGEARLARSGA